MAGIPGCRPPKADSQGQDTKGRSHGGLEAHRGGHRGLWLLLTELELPSESHLDTETQDTLLQSYPPQPRTGYGSRNLKQPDPRRKTLWTTHWSLRKTHKEMGVSGLHCRGGRPALDLTL